MTRAPFVLGRPAVRTCATCLSSGFQRACCAWINSRTNVYDELPFGGWKSSGCGKKHGQEAFDHHTETQSVVFGRQT
jgi:acyl-CoA reductase-like NAD-dependent aldehyde dehydrogenase